MDIYKIAALLGVVLAVVAAFVAVPYSGAALAILGAVVGWGVAAEVQVRVIVSAIALHLVANVFDTIPTVGPTLTSIISAIGSVVAGAAVLIILRNTYNRMMP
jgi:hypothetical protein